MLDIASGGSSTVYARVEYRQGDVASGALDYAYVMRFGADGSFEFSLELPEVVTPSPSPSLSPSPSKEPEPSLDPSPSWKPESSQEPEPSLEPMPSIEPEPGYTADEIAQMVAEKQSEIREKELGIKKAELELKKAQVQLEGAGIIKSVIKGKVKVAANLDAVQEGEPLVSVTGGEGFYVQGAVNELNLENVQAGDTVHVMNYMNGMSYEATIVEVSDMPMQTSGFTENPNESAYPFTVHIDGAAELNLGDYVEISYGGAPSDGGGQLYIDKMYVREEDGESFMFIAVEGKLKKQMVKTGKTLYGWCIEIKEGLTIEDYVAFPYGKLAKNGTKVNLPEDESGEGGIGPMAASIS